MQRSQDFLDPVLLIPALQELLKPGNFLLGEQFIECVGSSFSTSIDQPEDLLLLQPTCNAKHPCHLSFTDEKHPADIVI